MIALKKLLPKSVLAQILTGFSLVIAVFGLAVLATHALFESTLYIEWQYRQGRQQAMFLAKLSTVALYTENDLLLEAPVNAIVNQPEVDGIALYKSDGELWMKHGRSLPESCIFSTDEASALLLKNDEARHSVFEHDKNISFFAPVKMASFAEINPALNDSEEIIGLAQVVMSRTYFDSILNRLRLVDIMGVSLASILALLAGLWLARHLAGPIHKLSRSAQRIADGDLSEVHIPEATGEFSLLVLSFNQMLESLREREKLMAELRQAQKMEAIGTLAGGIAHDFNNILSAVIGYTEMALLESEKGSRQHDNLTQVLKASDRAKDLVSQILTFSRQSITEQKPILIVPIIKEVLKLLRASLPAGIEFQEKIESTAGAVLADPVQIHQIIMNLCTNAYQAMGEIGVLEVRLKEIEVAFAAEGRIIGLNPGAYLLLEVSDTGPGMEESIQERIFEPFFTTKKKGEGTGMGLAMVHGIMTECNGTIRVNSIPEKGTTFELYFPLVEEESSKATSKPFIIAQGGNGRVLLVDDEEALVQIGRQMLQYLGYDVTARRSSRQALADFCDKPGEFDIVVTDQTMPELSGAELARKIRSVRADIPIILYTGFSASLSRKNIKEAGIGSLIMKPLTLQKLYNALHEVNQL